MGGDPWIWGIYWMLIIISVVEIGSASSRLAYHEATNDNPLMRHTLFLTLGFFVFCIGFQNLSRANVRWVTIFGTLAYVFGVITMFLLPVFGRRVNGATRDIFGIQPVEFCKFGMIVVLCWVIAASDRDIKRISWFRSNTDYRRYLFMLILIALAAIPIMLQNLSSALILGFTALGIMFAGEVKGTYLRNTCIALLLLGGIGYGSLYGLHVLNKSNVAGGGTHFTSLGPITRANTWESRLFDKDDTPLWEQKMNDDNMQVMCAHMAIANSNGIGRFVGESQLRDHLPEAYSDYIYAIIFEELGIEGGAFVMFLYFALFYRCYRISRHTRDPYKRLLMLGLPLMIIIQALIHMGVSADAMFVTGQPLPLISRGGMSSLGTSACFGILFGVSHTILKEYKEEKRAREAQSE